jgi:hypothetical protein
MRKTNNNNILHFQKNINKQKTTKSFKTFFIKNLLILILFTLFFKEGKIEATIKTINKNEISFKLKIELTYTKREKASIIFQKNATPPHLQIIIK